MEEQKKKYLLNRIKKQQLVLQSDYDKFKRVFHNRSVPEERNESYTQLVSSLMDHNNQFALNLIEYLQKNQIKDIFQRSSAVFNDLVGKYKKLYLSWKELEEGKDLRQIRQICQICQEKIESNNIQNIKNILDRQAQARSNLIKKLIEQTEKERVRPLFTQEEDELFKQELDKLLKQKENSLQTNRQQSNIFLQTVTKEISDFMVSFRNDFATWEHSIVQENANWAQTMKGYLNKKLTNSFQEKIPKWIKKMHDFFVVSQPVKPKIFFANREVQTSLPSEQQTLLKKQVEELKKKIELKRQKIKQLFTKVEVQKTRNQNLQKQLSKMQKYMAQKIYEAKADKKNENKVQSTKSTKKMISSIDEKEPMINVNTSKLKQIREIPKGSILPSKLIKNVQKLVKTPINKFGSKITSQQLEKENVFKDEKDRSPPRFNKNQYLQIQDKQVESKSSKHTSMKNSQKNTPRNNNEVLKKSLGESDTNQLSVRLKKKGYNREKREEIVNEKKEESIKKQPKPVHNVANNSSLNRQSTIQLQEQVKNVSQILKHSSQKRLLGYSQHKVENVIKTPGDQTKIEGQQLLDQSLQLSKIHNLQSQIVHKNEAKQQSAFQSQLELKMKKYLDNYKKGRNKNELQQIFHLLNKYLNKRPIESNQNILEQIRSNLCIKEDTKKAKNVQNNMSVLKPRHKIDVKDGRYSKSLHVDRNIQPKQKPPMKLPRIVKNELSKPEDEQVQLNQLLEQSCLNLFINSQTAYFYQQSLSEVAKTKKIVKPTPSQFQQIELIFSQLQALKKNNHTAYTQIISFLKHPYTAIKCQFLTLDVIHDLNFAAFCNYFLRILWLHRNCMEKQNQNFCGHISAFMKHIRMISIK